MSANAALKEQTYTVDAADPVTVAGVAIIRTQKTGVLAEAFGRPEVARHKVAEKLKALGHEYDIDAMCLDALERYVEEHGEVPNASKVIASAQILDRLPDPQFDSGHRVVFAINEDGTDFIGASEMGLAISPSGTTTTSRSGKVDERFGAITKKTLWIMIDFPEESELDAIEVEHAQAMVAVAEAIADPATAAENFDAIVAQVQQLGEVTDMSPADVVATIETIANAIEAHTIATEVQTLVETGAASPDSPTVEAMSAKVETLSQQVTEQLASLDSALPPVIAETIQAVMETAQPPQAAAAEVSVDAAATASAPEQAQVSAETPTIAATEVAASTPETAVSEASVVAVTPETAIDNAQPVTQQQDQAVSQTAQTQTAEQSAIADTQTVSAETVAATQTQQAAMVETQTVTQTQQTPSLAEVVAQAPVSLKNDTNVITPQAFERIQPAAIAAQVTAIAAQLPAAVNTAQAQTVLKQVATAIKNDHHVPAVLQSKVEAVIAKMPEGPAKQELKSVVEAVKAKQEARKVEQPAHKPVISNPVIIRQAFANPVPVTPPTPTQPRPVAPPRNDNIVINTVGGGSGHVPTHSTGHGPAPVELTNPRLDTKGGPDTVSSGPKLPPTEGRGPEQPLPTHNDNQRGAPPTQPEGFNPSSNPDHVTPITLEPKQPAEPVTIIHDNSFVAPCGKKGACGPCKCPFNDSAATPEEAAAQKQQNTQAMSDDMAKYKLALNR